MEMINTLGWAPVDAALAKQGMKAARRVATISVSIGPIFAEGKDGIG